MIKRFAKLCILGLLLGLAVGLVLSGCGKPAEEAAKPEEAQDEAPKVIELKYSDFNPAGVPVTDKIVEATKRIEERTNGRIKITCYFAESLVKYPETFKGVSSGISDITYYTGGMAPGVLPLEEVLTLPFVGYKDYAQATRIYNKVMEKFPELKAEAAKHGVTYIATRPMVPFHIEMVNNKEIRVPADLKGQKIIADGYMARALTAAGATTMTMGPVDWYSSLQKGVCSGIFTHYNVIKDFKLAELTKTHTLFGAGGGGNLAVHFLANSESWNKIAPEDQRIIIEEFQNYYKEISEYDLANALAAIGELKAGGQKFIELTPEEIAQWHEICGIPAAQEWIKTVTEKGYDGQKIYDAIQEMIAADE